MVNRPIRRRIVVAKPIFNVPEEGYVTPRLKEPEHKTEAIGFTVDTLYAYSRDPID